MSPGVRGKGRADLHVHTTASDGVMSPAQVVDVAAARRLAAVGIADHDSVSGIPEARDRAAELGPDAPEVVPALEINTDYGSKEIHVLGYYVIWSDPALGRTLARLREGRLARVGRMLAKLDALGIHLSLDRVISLREEGSVGRPHVARALVEAGHVRTAKEAFEAFLSRGRPAYVERMRFTPREAVRAVRAAGGVPVLAHPAGEASPELIRELVAVGLEGLEVFHPDHDFRLEQLYLATAKEMGLVATGGSDDHGPGRRPGVNIGAKTVDSGVVEELRRRSGNIRRGLEDARRRPERGRTPKGADKAR